MAKKKDVLELIEQAAKDGRTALNLSSNQLTSVPPEIAKLTKLTSLDLRGNQLTALPDSLGLLTQLRSLELSLNQLTSLPESLGQLDQLQRLELHRNPLGKLPDVIERMRSLSVLHVVGTGLRTIPRWLGNLPNLKFLNIGDDELTDLPSSLDGESKLEKVWIKKMDLQTGLPEFLKHLSKLRELVVWDCRINDLPNWICELKHLQSLNLSGNQLTGVPPEITKLTKLISISLKDNQLTSVPPEITRLTNLISLDLSGNLLPIPPETLADPKDVKAIFAAIAGLVSGARLNEAKMLVVGDGKVGKSSVVERLLYNTYNPQKETTLGVEISDEMKVIQSEVKGEGEPVKLNIWDFGGQEIQHSTHQFFLTTRSLYLLVVDARKGDQISNIEYWLKLIESFGGDSPIIIVINQIDQLKGQRALNLDRKALQKKYNIRDFIKTSCPTGEGIPALKAAITREVEQLKHVRDIWPREWLAIKRRLKDMQADYIPVEKYYEICGEEKLNDEDLRQSLLGLLHDLGTVIRFPGDTQVLNPRWVTQGVYGLLTSAQLVKTQGQFDLKDVGPILACLPDAKDHYPKHTHERLIKVMEHFELCFEFTDRPRPYLIPRHLHDNELDIPWDDADALKFQYHYIETLPDSVISRFIVRMNQYITKQYYWKNGVFLQSGENRAKIKADLVDRQIFITIKGKEQTRRAFLAVIRSAFAEINRNFKIEIKQMIPVPGFPHVLVSYKELLVHEGMNEREIIIPELRKKLSVRELLDGVEEMSIRRARREHDLDEKGYQKPMSKKTQIKPQPPPKNNPLGSLMSFVFGFVILLAAIVGAAVAISKWVSVIAGVTTGVIIIGTLLAIGVVGAMQLRNDNLLTEKSFLKLMIESYRRLPLLKGTGEPDKQLEE